MPGLLEAKTGNTRGQNRCRELDSTNSPKDGKARRYSGGVPHKHHGGENEENISNVVLLYKPTDLTGVMTPGPEPDGGSPVLAWT